MAEKMKVKTPCKTIRQHCLNCSNGNSYEVTKCVITTCALYPYRFGKRPRDEEKYLADKWFLPSNDEIANDSDVEEGADDNFYTEDVESGNSDLTPKQLLENGETE